MLLGVTAGFFDCLAVPKVVKVFCTAFDVRSRFGLRIQTWPQNTTVRTTAVARTVGDTSFMEGFETPCIPRMTLRMTFTIIHDPLNKTSEGLFRLMKLTLHTKQGPNVLTPELP